MARLTDRLLGPLRAVLPIIEHRAQTDARVRAAITREFHLLYYNAYGGGGTWFDTYWMGVPVRKCPLDLWIYQELLFETKPDVIIEAGTAHGGSALYLASLCDLLGRGRVITIDIHEEPRRPQHPRVTYLLGSSTSDEILRQVQAAILPGERAMVILDSDHHEAHVREELRRLAPLVSPGCYLVVEDGNINGHPVAPDFGPGPWEAVEAFLVTNPGFALDLSKEKFLLTFNPRGYLKRRS